MKIKPIEVFSTQDADNNSKFKYKAVRELEANYQEAIDALYDYCMFEWKENDAEMWESIGIIEKAYGKSWEELKNELEL